MLFEAIIESIQYQKEKMFSRLVRSRSNIGTSPANIGHFVWPPFAWLKPQLEVRHLRRDDDDDDDDDDDVTRCDDMLEPESIPLSDDFRVVTKLTQPVEPVEHQLVSTVDLEREKAGAQFFAKFQAELTKKTLIWLVKNSFLTQVSQSNHAFIGLTILLSLVVIIDT